MVKGGGDAKKGASMPEESDLAQDTVEEKALELFGAECINGLANSNWKERQQAMETLLKKAFDEAHRERYGRGSPHEAAEIVSIRSILNGEMKKPALEKIAVGRRTPSAAARSGSRKVYFSDGGWAQAEVYRRDALLAGNTVQGPALIEEHASTTVLQPKDVMVVDPLGNLHITIGLS